MEKGKNFKEGLKSFLKQAWLKIIIVFVLFLPIILDSITTFCVISKEGVTNCSGLVSTVAEPIFQPYLIAMTALPAAVAAYWQGLAPGNGLIMLTGVVIFLCLQIFYVYLISCVINYIWIKIRGYKK